MMFTPISSIALAGTSAPKFGYIRSFGPDGLNPEYRYMPRKADIPQKAMVLANTWNSNTTSLMGIEHNNFKVKVALEPAIANTYGVKPVQTLKLVGGAAQFAEIGETIPVYLSPRLSWWGWGSKIIWDVIADGQRLVKDNFARKFPRPAPPPAPPRP